MPIRPAQLEDARQIAEVHVATWRDAYRGIVPDSLLDSLSIEAWTELWQERLTGIGKAINLVLVLDEKIIGWVAVGPVRDSDCDPQRTQQVYGIYLRSEYWGQGQGKELYSAAEHQMCQSGAIDAILWVFRDNIRACRFYEGRGYAIDRTQSEQAYKGDPSMIEVRYRKILSSLIPQPEGAAQ
jgi:ribosomal protein S18 acetylase RimI-like enzyme